MPSRIEEEWNQGELELQRALKAPTDHNPTQPGLPQRYHWRIAESALLAVGTLDDSGRPWTSLWGGEKAFTRPIAENVLGVNTGVSQHDPVFETLWAKQGADGDVVQMDRLMSGLAVNLESRDRVKVMGKAIAGAVVGEERIQMAVHVENSLGNCPKYINKKAVVPHDTRGAQVLESDGIKLGEEAIGLLGKADMFFLSSTDGESMDTNIRGGNPGLVRVLRNDDGAVELVYPEYSGNRLYQSLGNMRLKPLVGVVIPDYETGDVLYLTGTTEILIGKQAAAVISRSNLAIRIVVTESRFVKSGLPFRASFIDYSPYNPPIRYLTNEKPPDDGTEEASLTASLIRRDTLTPSISRFTFRLSEDASWSPGQHVTLDFEPELNHGYSHMNDDDPQSLNDDFVRTFTVSNSSSSSNPRELQITVKKHGPATTMLMKHNLRAPLELRVMGFGGKDEFHLPKTDDGRQAIFIAGGVGITPILAQGKAALASGVKLTLLWSVRADDAPLVEDTFRTIPELAKVSTLFITGSRDPASEAYQSLVEAGASVEMRRLQETDVEPVKGTWAKFFLCAPAGIISSVNKWLDGEDVVWEDFGY